MPPGAVGSLIKPALTSYLSNSIFESVINCGALGPTDSITSFDSTFASAFDSTFASAFDSTFASAFDSLSEKSFFYRISYQTLDTLHYTHTNTHYHNNFLVYS